ncbi:acyl-CoA N-acyltransferase [Hypoxylon sp. FL1284]|nr:acyl-CoA N-acyltransferase [Hypoxylon sp. FL1284]
MALPFPVPDTLAPAFTLSRCTEADIESMCAAYYDSFVEDPRNTFWWPGRPAMFAWMRGRMVRKLGDRDTRHFKVADAASGDLVSFARWDIPEGHGRTFGELVEEKQPLDVTQAVTAVAGEAGGDDGDVPVTSAPVDAAKPSAAADLPEGADPVLCNHFFDMLHAMAEKQDAKAMLGLSLLCTSPKYYRRGAAKALMMPMLALADAHGLKTYLEATSAGRPVYEKLGFREVDELVFDLKKLTGTMDELYKITIMVREPRPA